MMHGQKNIKLGVIPFRHLLLFLLRWHYSPIRTFTSLMDFSQSAPQSALFQICIFLFINIYITQFHHLVFRRFPSRLPWGILLNTWLTILLRSILLTWPIQFNRFILTNESISSQTVALIPYYIAFSFPSQATSRLAISIFNVQDSAQYFSTGLINVLYIFIFSMPFRYKVE